MIKRACYFFFILLFHTIVFGISNSGSNTNGHANTNLATVNNNSNWLTIVQKRLELEQKQVDGFLSGVKPEGIKKALDNALLFYKKEFDDLYKEIMTIFKESDDWIALRKYLKEKNEALNKKYEQINNKYLVKQGMSGKISENELKSYEDELKVYYNEMMEMFKKVITEGQTKEVKLRKEGIQEIKKERRNKPQVESIWTEEE